MVTEPKTIPPAVFQKRVGGNSDIEQDNHS